MKGLIEDNGILYKIRNAIFCSCLFPRRDESRKKPRRPWKKRIVYLGNLVLKTECSSSYSYARPIIVSQVDTLFDLSPRW